MFLRGQAPFLRHLDLACDAVAFFCCLAQQAQCGLGQRYLWAFDMAPYETPHVKTNRFFDQAVASLLGITAKKPFVHLVACKSMRALLNEPLACCSPEQLIRTASQSIPSRCIVCVVAIIIYCNLEKTQTTATPQMF